MMIKPGIHLGSIWSMFALDGFPCGAHLGVREPLYPG